MISRILPLLLLAGAPAGLLAQSSPPPLAAPAAHGDSVVALLPAPLRAQGATALAEPDDARRAEAVKVLGRSDPSGTLDFVLGVLATDRAPVVRTTMIAHIRPRSHRGIDPALTRLAAADPDAGVSVAALDALRMRQQGALARLVAERLEVARRAGSADDLRRLAREEQHYMSRAMGANLPDFMQDPPPLFSVAPAGDPIRVLAFGDFGTGRAQQKAVAAAMLKYHRRSPFHFGLTVGDNFYGKGMESPADPRWKTWWSDMYEPLGIEFYATLGNHDWEIPDSPASEILYTAQSRSWRMPATHYTYTAGPVQFFALGTDAFSTAQLVWLDEELARSTARWKVVYGHHPIYSAGDHGDNEDLERRLLPVMRGRVDVYLAGHDHDMQHLRPEGGVHFFVAGTGGKLRPVEKGPRSLWALSSPGFAVLDASADRFTVRFVDPSLRTLYEYSLEK